MSTHDTSGFITDPVKRKERAVQKQDAILDFLRLERYSNLANIALLLGTGEEAARQVLRKMVAKNLLIKDEESITFQGKKMMTLWGITQDGIFEGLEPERVPTVSLKNHIRGRVSIVTVEHTLDIQRFVLDYQNSGFLSEWQPHSHLPGQHLKKKDPNHWQQYPDGVAEVARKGGGTMHVAVEIERTFKTPQRYKAIIYGHLKNIDKGRYVLVLYRLPTEKKAAAFRLLLLRIIEQHRIEHHEYDPQTEDSTRRKGEALLDRILSNDAL